MNAEIANVQTMEQTADQTAKRRAPRTAYRRGQSGNPSGKSLTQRLTAELIDLFTRTHGRQPSGADLVFLHNAGTLSARLRRKSPRVTDADAVKCANSLSRILRRLKLEVQDNAQEQPQSDRYTGPKRRASTIKRDTE